VDLKHKAAEELAKMGAWSQDSLGYAREHGQRQLVWLLETVRGEVELEDALLALPSGEHLKDTPRDAERRELELRKEGQLAGLLGEPLPAESPAALERLASEDRRQAREGLVALMSGGKVSYKRLEELSEGDMPARIAANRLRETWLKERRDGWSTHGGKV
jgi:hypothetical protein